ncbi:bifunctional metallophosphatase/5'-nucleotidase [Archangium violaceum]|uniref:bifunctional metallophosphatase/5'-nucleotidase n=1 Tax=Archangium violaceum TaxID=83451 RepID=UPI0019515F64|nr:bifunctional UDP-sugar hydrolase/5'-nucleotidase [Archangium violaceum]QRN94274.1 bifunctional metallophosphatase/5'-nucleotidase [Archangium violaceum]
MRRFLLGLLCALLSASCMPVMEGQDIDLSGQEVRLTFLHTSDIHSRLIPYDFAPLKTDTDLGIIPEAGPFGGATRLGAILKRERNRAERVLHLDSGDCFQGAPIFNVNSGEAEFRFLSKMRLDAAVIGNHEFDAGLANFVQKARDFATFPLMAANYYWDSPKDPGNEQAALNSEPYVIRNVQGLKVGIIGMANISSLNSLVEGGNSLQATPLEQNEAARAYVEMLRPVVDLIVVVSHLGLTEDQDLIRGYEAYYEYERARPFIERDRDQWKVMEWADPDLEGNPKAVVKVFIPGVSGLDVIMGGHLHVVLNPPQELTDPSGRKVVLVHSGAFAKYVGRMDMVVKVPRTEERTLDGAEVSSHSYRAFPLDGLWCNEAMRAWYRDNFWNPGQFINAPGVREAIAQCQQQEDRETTDLLQPYMLGMDFNLQLTSIFSYAPRDVARRNTSSGGDSPLGNITADSMRKRRAVEAEMALTNSLGIRDNLYAGVVTQEAMFNVFPFENTINIMYLSGTEVQEMFDFVAERSASRGCVSQAQVSGARFTMDCAQVQLNDLRIPCDPARNASDCPQEEREGHAPWQCIADQDGERCYAHPATDISINGNPINPNGMYRVAVNDYIAKGGSGFSVLKRNTTRQETGISLRDSLIGYMQNFCTCDDVNAGRETSKTGERCGTLIEGKWVVDDQTRNFCAKAQEFEDALARTVGDCTCRQLLNIPAEEAAARCHVEDPAEIQSTCNVPAGPYTGRCNCRDALSGLQECGSVTRQLETFCENPTEMPIANAIEDGRIGRRVK